MRYSIVIIKRKKKHSILICMGEIICQNKSYTKCDTKMKYEVEKNAHLFLEEAKLINDNTNDKI